MVTKMATTTLASFFYVPTALALQRVRKTSKNRLKAQIRRKIHFETKKRAPTNLGTREITGADNRIRTYDLLITKIFPHFRNAREPLIYWVRGTFKFFAT